MRGRSLIYNGEEGAEEDEKWRVDGGNEEGWKGKGLKRIRREIL